MKICIRNGAKQEVDFGDSGDGREDRHLAVVDKLAEGERVDGVGAVQHAQKDGDRSFLKAVTLTGVNQC